MSERMSELSAEAKLRLIDEFRASLDHWNDAEDAENSDKPQVDLFSLLSEMAALKNEVRLESRQFKATLDELRRFGDQLREGNERLERDLTRTREQSTAAPLQAERRLLHNIIDLRDRMQAGIDAAGKPPTSFWTRLVPGPTRFAASVAQGQKLTLQRIDDVLDSYRVRPMQVVDQAFDPNLMRVVGIEDSPLAASGMVLREVRRGFLQDGEILRLAEVIVCKKEIKS